MAKYIQQISWHLEKADLEAMQQQAGSNYKALEFKMCIDGSGKTHYIMSLVGGKPAQKARTASSFEDADNVLDPSLERSVCPVPPGCN